MLRLISHGTEILQDLSKTGTEENCFVGMYCQADSCTQIQNIWLKEQGTKLVKLDWNGQNCFALLLNCWTLS